MDLDRLVEHQKIPRIHTSRVWWWIGLETTTPPVRSHLGLPRDVVMNFRTFLIQLSVRPGSPHLRERRARSSTRNVPMVPVVERLIVVSQPRATNQPQ